MAAGAPLTGYEPNLLDIPENDDGVKGIFTDRYFTQFLNDPDTQQPDPVEFDDEHPRSEFTPPLQVQERGARTIKLTTRMERVYYEVRR